MNCCGSVCAFRSRKKAEQAASQADGPGNSSTRQGQKTTEKPSTEKEISFTTEKDSLGIKKKAMNGELWPTTTRRKHHFS